jgi:hypothetical protein
MEVVASGVTASPLEALRFLDECSPVLEEQDVRIYVVHSQNSKQQKLMADGW